ncbi:MAG: PLP-dependent aminotransferase family protein, partial [Rhodospirillaceae bacterium]|nr:PLP-dependent aminotransferase family protein [Rhodospirillaceae bacterium]
MTMWVPQLSGRSGPRYVAIAEALAEDVRGGRLRPGDRLPTHRELAYRLGVTVGTVTRAYAEAERRGLVRGEVGRGTYVLGPPAAMPWQAARGRTEAAPPASIDLSTNIAWPGDAEADLARTLARLAEGDLAGLLGYQPAGALPAHRAAAAAWIALERGMPVAPEQVLVTGGGQQAMAVALTALARPGDLVLTEQLTYPGMRVLANRLHLRLQGVAMDEDGLIPEAFAAACRAGAPRVLYCMPSVQNPTGALMPEARRRAIAEIALDHDVAIVEDDVYGFLAPDGPAPLSVHAPR